MLTSKFAINENIVWDIISNSEQEFFQVKKRFTLQTVTLMSNRWPCLNGGKGGLFATSFYLLSITVEFK